MTNFLLAIIYPERWQWYRRWHGGKWSYWTFTIPVSDMWIEGWERPGCGFLCYEREDWSASREGSGA
jgi:hypothetical protein